SLVTRGSGIAQVLAGIVDLLTSIGARLRRCKTASCRQLFVANRPAQVRCGPSCGGTERVREWRHKHREQHSGNRHRQYARKIAKRLPGARVARRTKRKDK